MEITVPNSPHFRDRGEAAMHIRPTNIHANILSFKIFGFERGCLLYNVSIVRKIICKTFLFAFVIHF